ncbi:MAG: response regulator [Deltaproteobacteria bacterium]|nr:response regulator [Deltaproteobacteria bacterium]
MPSLCRRAEARLLVVDDEEAVVRMVERVLHHAGYVNVRGLTESARALSVFEEFRPDLVLLDLRMPGVDGYSVLEQLRARMLEVPSPIIVLTSDLSAAARQRALFLGALDFLTKPLDQIEILLRIANVLEVRYFQLRQHAEKVLLEDKIRERTNELEAAQVELLDRLARAAEFRDDTTGEHTERVGRMAARLARALLVDEREVRLIRRAAPLHDIGKVGIPDEILLKPARLSADERLVMEGHTAIGARILSGSRFRVLQLAEAIALRHHERWDGTGYPEGVAGDRIPLPARIAAVIDVYDALTHARPYKEAWTPEAAAAEIAAQSDKQFDPWVVETFLELQRAGSLLTTGIL